MTDIYDKTFMKKLNLGPGDIKDQCTGAVFMANTFILADLSYFQEWWWKK